MGKKKSSCRILVGKLDVGRPLRRPKHKWEDNIEVDLQGEG
jgi:hypothetical protein